jgi:hypothetical protein
MEPRTCICGCRKTFRVMKNSRQIWFSQGCETLASPAARKRAQGRIAIMNSMGDAYREPRHQFEHPWNPADPRPKAKP